MIQLLLISAGIVVGASLLIRRLLDFHSGRWAITATAIVLGEAAAIGILQGVTGDAFTVGPEWYPLGIGLVVTLSMLVLTVLELSVRPPARPRGLRIPRPVRALRRRLGRTTRYVQVSTYAIRAGLLGGIGTGPGQSARLGRALASTLEQSGGLFVKLGQAMASQPQLVTPSIAAELTRLQDQAAVADPEAAIAVLTEELGPLDATFAAFERTPIASASIGQTYFATLPDGRPVVVKVQRPGIAESMERDLDILARLANRLESGTEWAKPLGIGELAAGFAESTREELDFRIEAENGKETRRALDADAPITVPEIIEAFTTSRVLVQERVPGSSISTPGVFDGMPVERRRELADALLSLVITQMLNGGRFHADPHAGNVFLQPDGRLALIDFGAVGRLNRFERIGLVDLFRGLQREDPVLVRQAALRIGTPTGRVDVEALERELARLLSKAVRPDGGLETAVIGELIVVFRDFGLSLPRSVTVLFRTLFTLVGTLEVIAPCYDLLGAVARFGSGAVNPLAEHGSIKAFLQHEALSLAPVLSRLPGEMDDLARTLLRGELRTRISLFSEPEDVTTMWRMLDHAVMAAIGAAGLVASALLLTVQARSEMETVLAFAGGIGFAFSAALLLRTVIRVGGRKG
ncbi:AarF/UbiB family protein [Rathayibacter sp. VKM Ac-2835]|uniref:ABC1 kinase family protein n=1 Tax=Rathayibacter sp. VKM Ac-2835 TaxID=2739043 RepID=UPI001C277C97